MNRWISHPSLAMKLRFFIACATVSALLVAAALLLIADALHLLANLDLARCLILLCIAVVPAGLVAALLATRLQRIVCNPINELLEAARAARSGRKSSPRVLRLSDDELGGLVEGFNELLTELERRDLSLLTYQNELEKRVLERTERLDATVAAGREAVERAEAELQAAGY